MKKNIIIPVLAFFLLFEQGCKDVFFKPEPESDPVSVFDYLWNDFNSHYGPTEARNVNWDSLYSVFRPRVSETISDDSLYNVLSSLLRPLNDGHVKLFAPGKKMFDSNVYYNDRIDDGLFDKTAIRDNYLAPDFYENEISGILSGLLDSNIIYVNLKWIDDSFTAIHDAIDKYPGAKGLILDLRHNGGGDFTYCFSEMGRLTEQKRLVFTSRTKNGPDPGEWTDWYEWYIEPDGEYYDKKIVVLIDRYTISAGERTVMAFMTLPNATLIGDTTNGAHSTMIGRDLPNGWNYTLATQQINLFDGNTWEGIGLPPDIVFINLEADVLAGIDKTLERAISEF